MHSTEIASLRKRIKLHFYGAAGEVTGSATVISYSQPNGKTLKILVDCGLFQGAKVDREKNRAAIGYQPENIDAVILTHAHLDHSGLLPRMGREYAGIIYTTPGTADLLKVMLADSAKLQEEDADYANVTGYSNHKPAEPLYTIDDAKKILHQVHSVPLHEWFKLTDQLSFRFHRTGHIVGASAIELNFKEQNDRFTLGMSGDVGHHRHATLQGPEPLFDCDTLVLESTYGDRVNDPNFDINSYLAQIINEISHSGGTLIIPSFAVGRAQEIIYRIRQLEDQKLIKPIPIILDSPMSDEATKIYLNHEEEFKTGSSMMKPDTPSKSKFFPQKFEIIKNSQQSIENCSRKGPLIVISASGMLQGGRVLHHLKARLSHEKNIVLFVGYQAEGTKGRFLQSKPNEIRIYHEIVEVKARIESIPALSGHADQQELLAWVKSAKKLPQKIMINHGNPSAMTALKEKVETELKIPTETVLKPGVYEV